MPNGEKTVNIVSADGKQRGTIPMSSLTIAKQKGWKVDTGGEKTPWYVSLPYELSGYDPKALQEGQAAGKAGRKAGIVPGIVGTAEEAASGIPFVGAPLLKAMQEFGAGKYLPGLAHTGVAAVSGLMGPGLAEGAQEAIAPSEELGQESAQALRKAGKAVTERPSRLKTMVSPSTQTKIIQDFVNAKGVDISNKLSQAAKNVRSYIGEQAGKFTDLVDKKFPEGSIDANKILESTQQMWDRLHTIEASLDPKLKSILESDINADPELKALSQASVFKGSGGADVAQSLKELMSPKLKTFGASSQHGVPENTLRQLQQIAEQYGVAPPATGEPPAQPSDLGKWTAAQAKELRTKIGEMIDRVESMMSPGTEARKLRAASKVAYAGLSKQMRAAAQAAGEDAASSFDNYNRATRNLERIEESLVRPASIAAKRSGGAAVGKAISKDEGFMRESLKQLEKHGLNRSEVEDFIKLFKQEMGSPGWKRSVWRLAYGTPGGLAGMAAAWGMGAGWLPRIAAGVATGAGSELIRKGLKAESLRNLSPELERILAEREIPVP